MRSSSEGSSFSGLFTRVEMGHIVIGSRWISDQEIMRIGFETEPALVASRFQG